MLRKKAYLNAIQNAMALIVPNLNIFITLLVYLLSGNSLTPEKVY